MHLMYFTEQPMSAYPEDEALKEGNNTLIFSNKFFDPVEGSRLYSERLEEYLYAEEVGVDGIMLNEHHNTPLCMQAKANIFAAVLAGMTKRVKIVLLGNALPVSDNPIQLAEELGMIDMISKGRLVSGYVRGAGQEQYATNANPAYNRERFYEAHDIITKIWSEPGPFRWEGNHYQFRVVNPWVVPLQKPHPRIWIPGLASKETIIWAAEHRYPFIAQNTTIAATKDIWKLYDGVAERVGYKSGPEQRGYLIPCHVAETEEKAHQNGREFRFMQRGEREGARPPIWVTPPGYSSAAARKQLFETLGQQGSYEKDLESGRTIVGTPDQVIRRLRVLLEETRPSILGFQANHGRIDHEDSMTCIRLLGQEVMPALREIGEELGLKSPFELNTPVSLAQTPASELSPVGA